MEEWKYCLFFNDKRKNKTINNNDLHWFALKVFFNKVLWMESELKKMSVECYYPVKLVVHEHNGEQAVIREPAVSSLIFIHCSTTQAEEIQKCFDGRVILYRYRSSRRPAVISDREMNAFKMVTSGSNPDLEYMDAQAVNFKKGQHVRVTGGPFEGAVGYIQRIKGNKRLIVAIEGVVAVATSYIPSCYLQKLDDNDKP